MQQVKKWPVVSGQKEEKERPGASAQSLLGKISKSLFHIDVSEIVCLLSGHMKRSAVVQLSGTH